ncbi:MAG: hypothetical protein AVDCRST_MAG59-4248, partial [uncultured Thermomicrobiales bacterium]
PQQGSNLAADQLPDHPEDPKGVRGQGLRHHRRSTLQRPRDPEGLPLRRGCWPGDGEWLPLATEPGERRRLHDHDRALQRRRRRPGGAGGGGPGDGRRGPATTPGAGLDHGI